MDKKILSVIISSLLLASSSAFAAEQNTEWQQSSSAVTQQPAQNQQQAQSQVQGQQQQTQGQQKPWSSNPTTAVLTAQQIAAQSGNQPVTVQTQAPQGVDPASLEELPPPTLKKIQPFTPGQIRSMNKRFNDNEAAMNYKFVTPIPRISSQTVSLSAGSSIPQVRVFPNASTTITFSDATGHPWVLGAPPYNSSDSGCGAQGGQSQQQQQPVGTLCVRYIPGASVFTVQPVSEYASGNITVMLKGLPVPIIVNVVSVDPSAKAKTVDVDYRLDLRIPKRGPDTPVVSATPESKISLYDKQLQQFLDGIPPEEAQRVKLHNAPNQTQAWQIGDELYLRTQLQLQDEFEKTLSSIDGTHIYVLPVTPVLTLSDNGNAREVSVDLN